MSVFRKGSFGTWKQVERLALLEKEGERRLKTGEQEFVNWPVLSDKFEAVKVNKARKTTTCHPQGSCGYITPG